LAILSHTRYKILFLTAWYPNKKDVQIGEFVRKHIRAASTKNDCCLLYVMNGGKQDPLYELTLDKIHGFPEIRISYRNADKFSNAIRFMKAYRTGLKMVAAEFGRPDILHVNIGGWHGMIAWMLKKWKGIPYVFTEHWTGYASGKFRSLGMFRKWSTRFICRNAGAATAVSESLKGSMIRSGVSNPGFQIVPNVVEAAIVPVSGKRQKKILLTVADLKDKQKNISATIRAVHEISQMRSDLEYHIIGGGEDEEMLRQIVKDSGLADHVVFFHGQRDNTFVLDFLNKIDFLIVNSRVETFSVVTAEALLSGKPVVATRSGGPESFMEPGCGKLISPDDDVALREAILHMLDHSHEYDPLKLSASVRAKFSLDTIAEKLQTVYDFLPVKWTVGLSGERTFIAPAGLVLDVGSGHRPNPRANILLDNEMEASEHRSGKKAFAPQHKQMVIGDALNMPFGDKEFDYIIASHIAEHLDDPEKFGKELARTGRKGYIETPGPLDEFFLNEPFHKWVVKVRRDRMIFSRKRKFKPFSSLLYKIYYLNQDRTGHTSLHSQNVFLRFLSRSLQKIWPYLPGTYSKLHWQGTPDILVIKS